MENGNKKIVYIIIIIIEILIILGIGIWLIFNSGTPKGNNSSKKYVAYRWTDVSTDGYTKTNSYHGSEDWYTELNPNSKAYLRTDGTTPEVCGVFPSGIVCIAANIDRFDDNTYLNDAYFNITTISALRATGLKGYTLEKAEEMLNKGASSCNVSQVVYCKSSNISCSIHHGAVSCKADSNGEVVITDNGYAH